jgi:hypothetical protein
MDDPRKRVRPPGDDDDTSAGDDDTAPGDDDSAAGDDDTSAGDDDTAPGDDDSGAGDDDSAAGDDDTSAGDDDTSVGDDDSSAGDDDSSAGDDDDATAATEICDDAIDNDSDAAIDCSDSDCSGAVSCQPTTCLAGEILDCNGACVPGGVSATPWLGDTYCDDGSYSHNGVAIYMNCALLNWDAGDCPGAAVCNLDQVPDCSSSPVCVPIAWIGDGTCDDGSTAGSTPFSLNCSQYNFDAGDCP